MMWLIPVFVLLLVSPAWAQRQVPPPAENIADAIVYVSANFIYSDGNVEHIGHGSGVIINERGFILTSAHLIPDFVPDSARVELLGSTRSRYRSSFPLTQIMVQRGSVDMALLRFPQAAQEEWPYLVVGDSRRIELDDVIIAYGFPLDQDFTLRRGRVTSLEGPRVTLQTDAGFFEGMSGGPVLDVNNSVIGLVAGGSGIPGLEFFAPLYLGQALLSVPPAYEYREGEEPDQVGAVSERDGPSEVVRVYSVSETKDDHPVLLAPHSRRYERSFSADAGFIIIEANFEQNSANNMRDLTINIKNSGAAVSVQFRLESGPAIDRWRGWLRGELITVQVPTR